MPTQILSLNYRRPDARLELDPFVNPSSQELIELSQSAVVGSTTKSPSITMHSALSLFAVAYLSASQASAFVPPQSERLISNPRKSIGIGTNSGTQWPQRKSSRNQPPPAPSVPSTRLHVAHAAAVAEKTRNLAIAGRIPWRKLIINKAQGLEIISILRAETHYLDLAVMFFIYAFGEKIGKFIYQRGLYRLRDNVKYENSITYQVQENIGQAAILGLVCYCFDVIEVFLEVTGIPKFNFCSKILSRLLYASWAAKRVKKYKRNFFQALFGSVDRNLRHLTHTQTKIDIFDKISDFFLFGVLALWWIDILNIKPGSGLSSIFALGGAGTLALTLACQDLAKKVINGFALTASDPFSVGEKISLGDGTIGHIKSVGWLSTEVRGSDEIVTIIPNTDLSNVRIKNLSRMKRSQVKQILNFRYDDIDKIPDVVQAIRKEITASCPKVITDGSRPFRVYWTGYGMDTLEVMVDCRVSNPPVGNSYYEARQGIMEAIWRAVREMGIDLCPPTPLSIEFDKKVNGPAEMFIQDI